MIPGGKFPGGDTGVKSGWAVMVACGVAVSVGVAVAGDEPPPPLLLLLLFTGCPGILMMVTLPDEEPPDMTVVPPVPPVPVVVVDPVLFTGAGDASSVSISVSMICTKVVNSSCT